MRIIPLIYMKNRKIYTEREGPSVSLDTFLNQIDNDMEIYFFDLDGIEKDKPNLCTYQKLSGKCNMWLDAGPHNIGDITDLVMAGANSITIITNRFSAEDLKKIKEMTENKIYISIDSQEKQENLPNSINIEGAVVFGNKKQIEMNSDSRDFLKKIMSKCNLYIIENKKENIPFWEHFGVAGILFDFSKAKE